MATIKESDLRADLLGQLKVLEKTGKHFEDLVEDYIYLWKLKKNLQKDIKKNGIRYISINGNGIEVEKENVSVGNLMKVHTQMLKLLSDIGLQEPMAIGGRGDVDDYC